MIRPPLPPRLHRPCRDLWAKHILPISWEIIQLNEHIESRNSGRNWSLLLSSIWNQKSLFTLNSGEGERNQKTCGTYLLLPARHCGSLPLPGSCGQRRRRNLRPVCSVVRGRCAGKKGSHWAAACVGSGDCPCPFPPALHLCTTPPLELAALPPYSWAWQAPLWIRSGQMGALQS